MNAYRKARLGWAAISNGQLLFVALLVVWRAGGDIVGTLVSLTVAALCILGFVLEIAAPRVAAVFNVALPTTLGLLMLTAGFWLPLQGETERRR